ncbi:partial alpha-glucosidase, partial [Methylacidimicrobium cyclopophantes]
VAAAYRQSGIPCDGLHIDVDFQDNYRTFTHSEIKFPNAAALLAKLHAQGFKCSTNITPLLTDNGMDEKGDTTVYSQRQDILKMGGLIYGTYVGQGPSGTLFVGGVNYGMNFHGFNPYRYPPLKPNEYGNTALQASGNYPDLGRADVREAWGRQYAHLIQDLGMDMIWQDMMCPALDSTKFPYNTFPLTLMVHDGLGYAPNGACHNAYALFLAKATWEGLRRLRPDRRNFIIARGGFAGIQRYCALWTGDSASSWDFLAINLPEVLNLGLSGVPLSGCDIGGFAKGSASVGESIYGPGFVHGGVTNYELLTRWMHLGAFLPWYRNHYDGYNKQFQEPYNYGEPVPTHCRKYVELRYRMLQIHYDAVYEWTQTGMPPARALFLNDPSDLQVYNHLGDQFFVGRDFLVAPILFPAQQQNPPIATRSVYLPNTAAWYAFKDNMAPLDTAVPAGTHIPNWEAGLDQVPIYIRAGAILPMRSRVEQYVGQLSENPLEITVYPGPDRDYTIYLDDGITTRAENNGEYRTTRIRQTSQGTARTIAIQRLINSYTPPERYMLVRILYDPTAPSLPASVSVNGDALPEVGSVGQLAHRAGDAFAQDPGTRSLIVKVMDDRPSIRIAVGPTEGEDNMRDSFDKEFDSP